MRPHEIEDYNTRHRSLAVSSNPEKSALGFEHLCKAFKLRPACHYPYRKRRALVVLLLALTPEVLESTCSYDSTTIYSQDLPYSFSPKREWEARILGYKDPLRISAPQPFSASSSNFTSGEISSGPAFRGLPHQGVGRDAQQLL